MLRLERGDFVKLLFPLLGAIVFFPTCSHGTKNIYETASTEQALSFKLVGFPFAPGTKFWISQGAFGGNSHSEPGNEYHWDFDVPYGTEVVAVEGGRVFSVWEPDSEGGCDAKYSNDVHNVKILHNDGTIAQYSHIRSLVKPGHHVKKGDVIAVTAKNGFVCQPQLCFAVFRSKEHLYGSSSCETVPLRFRGVDGCILREGYRSEESIDRHNDEPALLVFDYSMVPLCS